MKKKSDLLYILINILCLALLIADIEIRDYLNQLSLSYHYYVYPYVMTNVAGPLIVCLLIVFRQSRHQKASLKTNIIVDSCSSVAFLVYNIFLFRFRLVSIPPMSFVILFLFIVPAIYNISMKIRAKNSSAGNL